MFIAYAVVAILLAAFLALSGIGKLTGDERVTRTITAIGVPLNWFPLLAACEFAGAVGLLAGIFLAPIGIAAAAGVGLYFLGATAFHLQAGDRNGVSMPLSLLFIAAAALVLRIASL
jgi:uncharacterized membrane protein YphA (DoxX/SURF4 family)